MRALLVVLAVQVAIGAGFVALAATGHLPFVDDDVETQGAQRASGEPPAARPARLRVDRFDERRAFGWIRRQVAMGPRPAGSPASRRLAARIRAALPGGRYQAVPGGLRNVVGRVPGRDPRRTVVVGAHYDTKDEPGFVGANDAGSGTAAVIELSRALKPRQARPTVVFILFDGEESPRGTPDERFEDEGLRGSRAAAPRYRTAEAMVLLDFVANRGLLLRREANSDPELWSRLRAAARRVGAAATFPEGVEGPVSDDHLPFLDEGVPAIDLIDVRFLQGPCWHRPCDDLSGVSASELDRAGETVLELLRTLG